MPRMHNPDRELMARVAERDADAFAELYDRHAPRVFGLILKIVGSRGEGEDVLQETFWKAWRSAARYDPDRSSPIVWLVQIARSKAVDQLRHRARAPAASTGCIEDRLPASQDEPARAQTNSVLGKLPAEQREAIDLAFYRGLTHVQIAEVGGIPLGTVKTRIRSGMRKLRELIEAEVSTP